MWVTEGRAELVRPLIMSAGEDSDMNNEVGEGIAPLFNIILFPVLRLFYNVNSSNCTISRNEILQSY